VKVADLLRVRAKASRAVGAASRAMVAICL
jgi:hypothetical protein